MIEQRDARYTDGSGRHNVQARTQPSVSASPSTAPAKAAAAQWYASVQGWRVLLLHHITPSGHCSCGNRDQDPEHDYKQGGKHPVHSAWQEKATTDLPTIETWWRSRPQANVGIATGRESGIFVLDVDPDNGGFEALAKLEAEYGTLPATWYVETGSGGGHWYFNYPDFEITNASKALRALGIHGIDIRGDGGQVVAPPSVSGKGPYISTKTAVVDAPSWLLNILRPKPREAQVPPPRMQVITSDRVSEYTRKVLQDECDLIVTAQDGEQNDLINTAAFNVGQLVAVGALSEGEARQALASAARAGNHPEGRALRSIESGLTAGMAEPRSPWPPVNSAVEAQTPERIKRGVYASETQAQEHFVEPPDPLGGAELLPPAPINIDMMAPPVLAAQAKSVADFLQLPVEGSGLMGVSVLSVASLGRYVVRDTRSGWTQPPIIRTLTLLRAGERKSDAVRLMAGPLEAVERERWRAHEDALKDAEISREKLELALEDVRSKLKRDSSNKVLLAELDGLKLQLAGLPDPSANPPQLTISDSTPEALVQALHDNRECLGMLLAEDTLFAQIAGMYSGTPNLGIYLSSYDEEKYIVNRVGKGVRVLWNPALAIGMLVQPHVVEGAAKIPNARSSGLLGRWIFSVPKSLMGERLIQTPPLDHDAAAAWADVVHRLLAMPVRPEDVPVVHLDDDAHRLLTEFRAWLEPTQKDVVGRYAHMTDWTGKVAGTVLRLSGIYHFATGRQVEDQINAECMTWAVNLGRWACGQAEYVHRFWRTTESNPAVEWIIKWLRTRDSDTFTRRDLTRSGCSRQEWYSPEALDDALAELHRTRWIASVADTDAAGRQKSSALFTVHPAVKGGPQHG
ncbi:DUF3987 domain-containing protein [Streptomyces canus]|uniref:DUF3987 domain-containing protein n=1 Tax=Streptomyces canus TaxID=58343 RepID=UPI0038655D40|nr:DUF3987 domain-containing protein [Streptomyces canus]